MPDRIIDKITEADDYQAAREDWTWIVTPLANVVTLSVEANPQKLYINAVQNDNYYLSRFEKSLSTSKKTRIETYDIFLNNHYSLCVFLGDIGVGKTSWIYRFIHYLNSKKTIYTYYYDHHKNTGRGDNSNLPEARRLINHLYTFLLLKLKEKALELDCKNLQIFKYDIDGFASSETGVPISAQLALKEASSFLFEKHGLTLYYIIDNLDEYSSEIQEKASEFATHICDYSGIKVALALRPETYHNTKLRLIQVLKCNVLPVSIAKLLRSRINYLLDERTDKLLMEIAAYLDEKKAEFNLKWSSDLDDSLKLKKIYFRIIDEICSHKTLINLLTLLHNYNTREILEIISQLLKSKFFSEKIIASLSDDSRDTPSFSKSKEAMITGYLRGPYKRHRGFTADYRVRSVNIFSISNVSRENMLIAIRVLQQVDKSKDSGATVEALYEVLTRYGYPELSVKYGIECLAKNLFIRDVYRQKLWPSDSGVRLQKDDRFILHPAGVYLINELMTKYAFRYCEAISDTMSHSRNDGLSWNGDKYFSALIENAYGALELIISQAIFEYDRVLALHNKTQDIQESFIYDFYNNTVLGYDFAKQMAQDCKSQANRLIKFYQEKGQDFSSMARRYEEKFNELYKRTISLLPSSP